MTLKEFLNMWIDPRHKVIVCEEMYCTRILEQLDDEIEGSSPETSILEYIMLCFEPRLSTYNPTLFLHEEIAESIVEHFFIRDTFIVVCVTLEKDDDEI